MLMSSETADKDTKKGGNDAAGPPEENLAFSVEWLDLSREVIEEKHTKNMARALENGELKNLKILCLHNNAGDIGMRATLNALQHSGLPSLEKLILWNVSSYDQITAAEEGTDTIANAIANNKMPKLQTLDLTGSLPKLIPPRSWMRVFKTFAIGSLGEGRLRNFKKVFVSCCCTCTSTSDPPGKKPSTLECCCHMCGNYIYSGNDGVKKIVEALRVSRLPLKVLNLRDNHIGDEGVESLAKLFSEGALPLLEEVDLRHNPLSEVGEKSIVRAYLENPLLTASVMLDWSDQIYKERASAFREKNLRLEHRLKDPELVWTNMEHAKISKCYKWNPDYSICRPSKQEPYRFRMRCQNEAQDHVTCAVEGKGAEGIPIKEKPLFSMPRCCSTPDRSRKLVNRQYIPGLSEQEEKSPANLLTVTDGNGEERVDEPSSLKCCSPSRLLSLRRQQQPTTDDFIADTGPPVPPDSLAEVQTLSTTLEESRSTSAIRLPSLEIQQQATTDNSTADTAPPVPPDPVVARKGKALISVTLGTRFFIMAARYLKNEETGFRFRFIKWLPFIKVEKTKRQIEAIKMELLMLADRKPREFQDMFGLARVLLEDPDAAGCHYPAYICEFCRVQLVEAGKSSQTVVKPCFLNSFPAPQLTTVSTAQPV